MGTYLITGATGGIGTAVTELLRERGHDLILTGRSPERLERLAKGLSTGAHAATQVITPGAVASPAVTADPDSPVSSTSRPVGSWALAGRSAC